MEATIEFKLNGKPLRMTVDDDRMLLWVLRYDLELTGCKYGCGEGHCGACTVLVDDNPVRSCQVLVTDVQGKEVVTIEGLAPSGTLHPLQKAFVEHDALQCGFCTPGMILRAASLLQNTSQPSRSEIIQHMDQSFCRCGAHTRIVQAIESAARQMSGGAKP